MPPYVLRNIAILVLCTLSTLCAAPCQAATLASPGDTMRTPVRTEHLDAAALAEWVDGQERAPTDKDAARGPGRVLWTADSPSIGYQGFKFGNPQSTGISHLRIGFTEAVPVGTVFARGDVQVAILKAGAPYPGDLGDDTQWITGQRLEGGTVTSAQTGRDEMAFWVFPKGSDTRALRFTHLPRATDTDYTGVLKGSVVLPERLVNLAALAQATASADNRHAPLIINGELDSWGAWQNMDFKAGKQEQIPLLSREHPEWLMLNWAEPVSLDGLMVLWSNCGAMDVQTYVGPASRHPRDASERDWRTVERFDGLQIGYVSGLWPNYCRFDKAITTAAIRVRITGLAKDNHPHLTNKDMGGKRLWFGELMALHSLAATPLSALSVAKVQAQETHPPIPVRFTLPADGYVTLVIEDASGKRVRNLVSETWFPKGDNTAWWDGTHDLDRDQNAINHGLYQIPARFVAPGDYQVRGLWRKKIEARYEFSAYNAGSPPWNLQDHTGAWLANHSPPSAAVFVPATHSPTGEPITLLGSYVTEGPDGLIWTDMDMAKQGGLKWVGGNWTAAPYLGRDSAPDASTKVAAYVAAAWAEKGANGEREEELRINALETNGNGGLSTRQVYKAPLAGKPGEESFGSIRGIAAYDGTLAVSFNRMNQLLFLDSASGKVIGTHAVNDPRGLIYDAQGRLYLLSGTTLLRYEPAAKRGAVAAPATLLSQGLEDPYAIALDQEGRVYISDHGNSHQVKVFAAAAKPGEYQRVGRIGKPGKPQAGAYDPLHMNHPAELTIDAQNRLWVTEHDYLPKRISVWSTDGTLLNAVYGPSKYGGGGQLDAQDKSKFYYAEEGRGFLEFDLDWKSGKSTLVAVPMRRDPEAPDAFATIKRYAAPESAAYRIGQNAQRYFHNSYNSSPVAGTNIATLHIDRDGLAIPVAAMGIAQRWPILQSEPFRSLWPEAGRWEAKGTNQQYNEDFFIWSDLSGDGMPQPDEVRIYTAKTVGGVTIMDDFSFLVARLDGKALRFRPVSFSERGVPSYDYAAQELLAEGVLSPKSSGGDQVLADGSDEAILTLGVEPFSGFSLTGTKDGKPTWSYPSLWPGLHASHHAAKPERPGEVIGSTRLMGGFVHPKGSEVAPLWAVNGNMGNFYLFTRDGLFVATIFTDSRLGTRWKMRLAERGMNVEDLTLSDENFWPTINQTPDGKVYAVDGSNTCIVRLDGLDSLRPIAPRPLVVTAASLQASQAYVEASEVARQNAFGSGTMTAAILPTGPTVDGAVGDWRTADWVEIDKRGDGANFNSNAKPYNVLGAISADSSTLYAAWDTNAPKLLENSGEVAELLFKTGGALDLMIGGSPAAKSNRQAPVEGDLRLLVTRVAGQTRAMLYRGVVPGTPASEKVPFTSPVGSVSFDRVEDVSDRVKLAADGKGGYEIAVPLSLLGLKPVAGQRIKADIGILRGDGNRTVARSYWSNKATGITADTPSEAKLSPHLWGTIEWK